MSGVRLGRRAHHDSFALSGITLWPISGQQPVYVTQKYQISSLGTLTEVRLKKYQVPNFGDRNTKKAAKLRRVQLVLSVEKGYNMRETRELTGPGKQTIEWLLHLEESSKSDLITLLEQFKKEKGNDRVSILYRG